MTSLSHITGYEQTRSSWLRVLEGYDQVPPFFAGALRELMEFSAGEAPYLLLAPSMAGFLQKSEGILIAGFAKRFYVLDRQRAQVRCVGIPYRDVRYIEVGSLLLKSWLTVLGSDIHGEAAAVTIPYNTARESLWEPILARLRPAPPYTVGRAPSSSESPFDPWLKSNFKLANLARLTLRPGEHAEHILLQPELRDTFFAVAGFALTRLQTSAHLCMLTDSECIVLQDDLHPGHHDYGTIWRYIRRADIEDAALSAEDGELLRLTIHFADKGTVELIYAGSQWIQVDAFRKALLANREEPPQIAFSKNKIHL
jgi:hypothetical protein